MCSRPFETRSFPNSLAASLAVLPSMSLFLKLHSTCRFAHLCRSRPRGSVPSPLTSRLCLLCHSSHSFHSRVPEIYNSTAETLMESEDFSGSIAINAFGDEGRSTYVISLGTRIDLSRFGDPPQFNAAVTQQNGHEARSQYAGNNR